jgi:metallo-beta-lactamase family protein
MRNVDRIRLHFWGAAQTVTGSSNHLECAGQNVLLDCGLFQGHRQQAREINEHLALPAEQLNAVVLSHARIMRGRRLSERSRLWRRGFAPAPPGFNALLPLPIGASTRK